MARATYFCTGKSRGWERKKTEKRSGFPFPVVVAGGMSERALPVQAKITT